MADFDKMARQLVRAGKVKPSQGANAAWTAMAEANRIFGPHGWTREVLEMRNAANRERDGVMTSAYVARVRITASGPEGAVIRDGYGCGEGRGQTPFEAHDHGLKAAELDATLRALATFGKAFGLHSIITARVSPGAASRRTQKCGLAKAADEEPDGRVDSAESPPGGASVSEAETSLMIPKSSRKRSPAHLAHVRAQPCLVCGRSPSDAHHLRFVQARAMAKKVSDEFTVPLCRRHHDLLHRDPDEPGWWAAFGIDPLAAAEELWLESHGRSRSKLEGVDQ